MPKVFISYSHKDEAWKDKLLPHLQALEQAGMGMVVWQDRQIDAGEKWHPAIQEAMADAVAAVLLISADYLASGFCIKEEVPYLLDRQEREGMRLVPVLIRKCPWKAHRWLAARQMLPRDGKCVAIDFPGDHADGVFSHVAELVLDHLSKLASDPDAAAALPKAVRVLAAAQGWSCAAVKLEPQQAPQWPVLPAERIDLTRLPETGAALFGRDQELQLLDDAWASAEAVGAARIRILAFTAHGGVGKSTLVNHWLREVQREHFRGAGRVFGWSFYSQGTRDQTASADAFIDAALRFFGDPDPAAGSPWDKGERLARRAGAERALLVLDGLEPLQSGHAFDRGKLRDPALASLLRGLARQSGGLCLITTREPLPDLAGLAGVTARDLEHITPEAGRALLRTARVAGTDAELEGLAKRFGPHALAVSLVGVYLYENDSRHGIGAARALEHLPGDEPLDRVLAGFEQWLAASTELEVLRLLGLFDRPADTDALGALRATPAIPGLTDRVVELSDAGWDRVLDRLEKLRLVHPQSKDAGPPVVDAHPLLREHFANQLRERQREAWREGHRRLYEHLKASVPYRPEGLAGLEPLYQAVAHGCKAGLYEEARAEVYRDRILRGTSHDGFYSARKLGAFGADLGAVACFFEEPWKRLAPGLPEEAQAWLLNQAASCLRALGRLTESLDPIRAATAWAAGKKHWEHAAVGANNLSELELTLGEMAAAVRDAEQSVEFGDRSGDASQAMIHRTTLADARHQSGARADALALLWDAEAMQAQQQPEYPLLSSVQGFQYCDLLLGDAERMAWATCLERSLAPTDRTELQPHLDALREVEQRAAQTLKIAEQHLGLLSIALDRLTLGRVALYRAILERSSFEPAREPLTAAVDSLRAAGSMDHVPRGFLSRAWLRFLEGDAEGAQADLDESWQIAERGAMKLHMADVLLHRARLFRDRAALDAAAQLIEKTGYHRRDDELRDAREAAQHWPQQRDYPLPPEADSSDASGVATLDAKRGRTQDSPAAAQERPMPEPNVPKPVFISYAHKDNEGTDPAKRWLDRLKEQLEPLVQQDNITVCSDQEIGFGDDWHGHIQAHLNGARAAVLLVSPAFLASKYIRSNELPVLLRNAKENGVKIIPVILRPCLFEETKFKYPDPKTGPEEFTLASLQAAGSPAKALSEMSEGEQDRILVKVAQALAKLINVELPRFRAVPVAASIADPPPLKQSSSPVEEKDAMRTHQFNPNRLGQLEELLEIEYEKLHEFDKAIALADGISQKIALRQQIKRDLTPRLRKLEQEYAELLAVGVQSDRIPEAEAQELVAEVVSAVVKADEAKPANAPQEMVRLLSEIRDKLDEPGKSASAKLKLSLPIIPLISSYEIELDTAGAVTGAWRKTRDFFKRLVSNRPN